MGGDAPERAVAEGAPQAVDLGGQRLWHEQDDPEPLSSHGDRADRSTIPDRADRHA